MGRSGLYQTQELTLRQELQLAPQQILSLELLTVPLLELQARVNQELETNPTLDRHGSKSEELAGDPIEEIAAAASDEDLAGHAAERDEVIASLAQSEESWQDYLPPGHARQFVSADDEEKRRFFFDSLTTETSLEDDLLEQLRTSDAAPKLKKFAEEIIGNIDTSGYLRVPLVDMGQDNEDGKAELSGLKQALKLVQSFEPPGIGARDLRESLLLQLERADRRDSLAYQLVEDHLEEIGKNRIPQVAKALNVTIVELYDAWNEVKRLRPRPGSAVSPGAVQYVLPEVTIERVDGEYRVSSNREYLPRLSLSKRYLRLLDDPETPAETKSYIREKINSGKVLIKSLAQRDSTVHRITEVIAAKQREFLDHGEASLKPLTMNEVAENIGVHETTVSRAIANKYVQSPQGLLPLRHFFGSGFKTESGEMLSNRSIKHRLEELVNGENPSKPLSDKKIVELLKEGGLNVARRTVAKYREELGIQPSHLRKSHVG